LLDSVTKLSEHLGSLREMQKAAQLQVWAPLYINTFPLVYFYSEIYDNHIPRRRFLETICLIDWNNQRAIVNMVRRNRLNCIGMLLTKRQLGDNDKNFGKDHFIISDEVSRYDVSHILMAPGPEILRDRNANVVIHSDSDILARLCSDKVVDYLAERDRRAAANFIICRDLDVSNPRDGSLAKFTQVDCSRPTVHLYCYSAHSLLAAEKIGKKFKSPAGK
jgi:hypothetical protein